MATTFNQGALVAPTTRRSVAELIDTLQSCWTDSQLRAWLAVTFNDRLRLAEPDLSRIEAERHKRQRIVDERRRQEEIAERVALARADRALCHRLDATERSGHRSPLLRDVHHALKVHRLSPSTFGRLAMRDPCLVADLEKGRSIRPALEAKVRAYIAQLEGGAR